ncbi:MAG: acyl-CoA synthetase, partial [Methylococcales bacterium]|nr:acyl-CoA synthetase [Methylococcales bacterium]
MNFKALIDPTIKHFDQAYSGFQWNIPDHFNIAYAVCDRHITLADKTAMVYEDTAGKTTQYTFGQIKKLSNRLANALLAKGVTQGDRVALVLPQCIETAITHIALYKIKAIVVPLSILFGPDALAYRLKDSGAKMVISDAKHQDVFELLMPNLPALSTLVDVDSEHSFWRLIENAQDEFSIAPTPADTPALLIYTSGTTGPPKGACIAHRCLLGNLP